VFKQHKLTLLCLQDSEGGAEPPPADAKSGKPSKKAAGKTAGKAAAGAAAAKAEKAAEQQRQAQLELLMMDDSALQDVARIGKIFLSVQKQTLTSLTLVWIIQDCPIWKEAN